MSAEPIQPGDYAGKGQDAAPLDSNLKSVRPQKPTREAGKLPPLPVEGVPVIGTASGSPLPLTSPTTPKESHLEAAPKTPMPRQDSMRLAEQRGMQRHDPSPSPEARPADSPVSAEGPNGSFQVTLPAGSVGIELAGAAPAYVSGLSPSGSARRAGVTMGAQLIKVGDVDLRDKPAAECTTLINSANPPITLTLERPGSPPSRPIASTNGKKFQRSASVRMAIEKAEVFLVHNFIDPSDELPEDEMGLRITPRFVDILDPDSREVVHQWDWDDMQHFDGYADDTQPDSMDMLIIRVLHPQDENVGFLEYRFELEDHRIVIEALEKANRSSGVMRRAAKKLMLRRQESTRRAIAGECSDAGSMATSVEDLQRAGATQSGPQTLKMPRLPFLLIVFTIFFGVGIMVPVLEEEKTNENGEKVPWTVVDGFYYSVQTMTTVGYGDLTPTTDRGRIVVMMYLFFAVGFIGVAIRSLHVWYQEVLRTKKAAQRRIKLRQLSTINLSSGQLGVAPNATLRREMRQQQREAAEFSRKTRKLRRLCCLTRSTVRMLWAMMLAAMPVFALGFAYSVALYFLEDILYLEAVYIAVATGAAVGYGDYSPKTQGGRLVSIFVIPVFVIMTVGTVGNMVKIAHSRAHNNTSVKGLLQTRGVDDEITLPEFQMHMLKAWKKIKLNDLETIDNMFQSLDSSGDGVLNAEDIDEASDHRASMIMQAGTNGTSRKVRV